MADKWQMPQNWKQRPMAATGSQLVRGSGTEQPQPQSQLQRARQFSQDLGSTTHQSHQLYSISPHMQPQSWQSQARTQPQSQSYHTTGSSSINDPRPDDNLNTIFSHLLESLNRLGVQQQHVTQSLSKSDKCFEALVSSVLSIRETADGLTKKLEAHDEILGKLERSSRDEDKKVKEIDVMKVLVGEIKAFKKTLGKSCDGDDGRTVLGRLDAVTFAVGELLERARDPEANLPGPSPTATTTVHHVIDLTESSPPPVRRSSPVRSHTHANMGTSSVRSPLSLKETSFASAGVSTLLRSGSNSFGSLSLLQSPPKLSPYPGRSSSAHSFANDTITSPDRGSGSLTQDNHELASLIPMDVDAVGSTEPMIDSQTSSTTSMHYSDDAGQTQTNPRLSDHALTMTTKTPGVETIRVHSPTPSDLASAKDAQTSQITGLDGSAPKIDKSTDILNAGLPNVTPNVTSSLGLGTSTFIQLCTTDPTSPASPSSASPAVTPLPFTQSEMPRSADKTIAALSPSMAVTKSSVSEGKQQQNKKKQSRELLKSLPISGHEETLRVLKEDLDDMVLKDDLDNRVKEIEKRILEVDGKRINLGQHIRGRRSSSSRFASPTMSSLSSRGRTGSRPSVGPSEDVSYLSRLSSDTKLYSPTKTKVLAGVGASRSPGAPPTASVLLSHPALRPTTANAELVAVPVIRPATPASIFTNPSTSTRRTTPVVSESSHLESASTSAPVLVNKSHPLSQTSTLPAATSSIPVPAISPTKNSTSPASSRLDPVASPVAIFNEPPPPSQASTNATQDEASVSKMVIENESNGGENLVEKPTGTPLPLSPPMSDSPHLRPAKVSGPSTLQSTLSFTLLPSSPLASAAANSKRTQNNKTPEPSGVFSLSPLSSLTCTPLRTDSQSEFPMRNASLAPAPLISVQTPPVSPSPSPISFVAVVSPSSPAAMNLDKDQPDLQSPLFSSPSTNNNISPKQRDGEGEGVALKLQSSSGTTYPTTTPTTSSKVAALASNHILPTQSRASVEMSLPGDLSPIPNVEKGKRTAERTDKTRVEKLYTSLDDDADIVRARKRKVSDGSSMTDRELSASLVKEKTQKEVDDLEVETKSDRPAKKRSLFNQKAANKGESVAVTRVKKRKAKPDLVDEEANGERQHNDGLDEERPLKRARQRIPDRQFKVESVKKAKQLSREFSVSSLGSGSSMRRPRSSASVKKDPPSKGKLSVNLGQREAEVDWPMVTRGDRAEDLVGCDKCTAWYHYGCVGISAGDKRLRDGKKFFCPPCEAGTAIKKFNKDTDCWRPGCSVPTGYIVEKIIGRFKKFVGGQGLQFKYLLQWKGYNLSESSWEPAESMFDPPFMIEKFRLDALEEGIDIDQDTSGLVLLQAAKDPSVPPPT